ncbi:hypothetical protein D3C78_1629720 [compost metagenome]
MPLTLERTSISRKPAVSPTTSVVRGTSAGVTVATTTGTWGWAWASPPLLSPQPASTPASARAMQPRLNVFLLMPGTFIFTLLPIGPRWLCVILLSLGLVNDMLAHLTFC